MSDTAETVPTQEAEPAPQQQPTQVAVREKVDSSSVSLTAQGAGSSFMPKTMQDVVTFATLMAKSDFAIPPRFRQNPGACLAVTMQALRWEADPFAVVQKAYVTASRGGDERIAYEAQMIAAMVNTRGGFKQRPSLAFEGEGAEMRCSVEATFKGEDILRTLKTPMIKDIAVKNSPLWKGDPEQQLSYYALRAFGRRWCPEVLMGIYSPDEVAMMDPEGTAIEGTATAIPPRPGSHTGFERKEEPQKAVQADPAKEAAIQAQNQAPTAQAVPPKTETGDPCPPEDTASLEAAKGLPLQEQATQAETASHDAPDEAVVADEAAVAAAEKAARAQALGEAKAAEDEAKKAPKTTVREMTREERLLQDFKEFYDRQIAALVGCATARAVSDLRDEVLPNIRQDMERDWLSRCDARTREILEAQRRPPRGKPGR